MDYYIVTAEEKKSKIKELTNNKGFLDFKIIEYHTFVEKYYFRVTKQMIYTISSQLHVKPSIAKIYVKNLCFLKKDNYQNEKLQFLSKVKKILSDNGLLIDNFGFRKSLTGKKIVFSPYIKQDQLFQSLIDDLNVFTDVEIELLKPTYEIKEISEYQHIEDEVIGVTEKIVDLLKDGININQIYLANLDITYKMLFADYFKIYNVPYTFESDSSLYGTRLVQLFFQYYQNDIQLTLNQVKDLIKNKTEEDIYAILISLCNEYLFISDFKQVKSMLQEDLKKLRIPSQKYENAVRLTHLNSFKDEKAYVFFVGCNQGALPFIYKDENYLTDVEYKALKLPLVSELNQREVISILNQLKTIKNLYMSYKLADFKEMFYPTTLLEKLKCDVKKKQTLSFAHSHLMNKITLAKNLDQYFKFGKKTKALAILYHNYVIDYKTYDHQFKGIDERIYRKFQPKLELSFTKIDSFYHCPFQYYLKYVLKLNEFEDSFMLKIGSIYHAMLERVYEEFNFDQLWTETVAEYQIDNAKELYFLSLLKERLKEIMKVIQEQSNLTNLKALVSEKKVDVTLSEYVIFRGIIDKILFNENLKLLSVIDYKTGGLHYDLNYLPYGLNMQLPIYLFLLRYTNFKDYQVAGFYMQKLLHPINKNNEDDLIKKQLMLNGYSNQSSLVLQEWDSSYQHSELIKGMRLKKDGFFAYAKVISDQEIDAVINIARQKILASAESILAADFAIHPKKIGDQLIGCEFCAYSSLCYKQVKDYELLEEIKDLQFLKEVSNNANVDERTK